MQKRLFWTSRSIFKKRITQDIPIILKETQAKSLRDLIRQYVEDFVHNSFNQFIEAVYDEIYKSHETLEPNDKIYYFVLYAIGIQVIREKYHLEKRAKPALGQPLSLDLVDIGNCIQLTQFDLIYSTMVNEVTKVNRKSFDIRMFHSSLYALLQLLYLINDMSGDSNPINR